MLGNPVIEFDAFVSAKPDTLLYDDDDAAFLVNIARNLYLTANITMASTAFGDIKYYQFVV